MPADSAQRSKTSRSPRRRTTDAASLSPLVAIASADPNAASLLKFFDAFDSIPAGLSFVLIAQHDEHDRPALFDVLQKRGFKTAPVEDGSELLTGTLHVVPRGQYVSLRHSRFRVSRPDPSRPRNKPIDFFFRSLAREMGEEALVVMLDRLSGDGLLGLKAIKAEGGTVLLQTDSASPALADLCAKAEELPAAISRWHHSAFGSDDRDRADAEQMAGVLKILRRTAGFELRHYKRSTLRRRIRRRMDLRQIATFQDYAELLEADPPEASALTKELLIGVTSFFREPPAWRVIEEKVLPQILLDKEGGEEALRVWVPGCSTGEEAYTIAMLLIEALEKRHSDRRIQIFATDLDRGALEIARTGVYSEAIAAEVTPERLERFFHRDQASYRVKKELRERIVFAQHDVISDPPYSKVDLVTCRNLLIYLQAEVQRRIIPLFHFALRERGFLMLGTSETIGPFQDHFQAISKKWRIYRRIGPSTRSAFELRPLADPRPTPLTPLTQSQGRYAELAQSVLLRRYAPASVLLNRNFEVLYFYGPTSNYLLQPTGEPTTDVLSLAREGLRGTLRAGLHKAVAEEQPVVLAGAQLERGGLTSEIRLTITPFVGGNEPLILVSFEDFTRLIDAPVEATSDNAVLRGLEQALKSARDELRTTIEELQSSNEELMASNEEVMSMNEELQATNEELETSKEELQSLNEELTSLNHQLEEKVEQLEQINDDLNNLLSSTSIATLFLDTSFRIKRYTPAATKLFSVIPQDLGREIADIVSLIEDPDLLPDAQHVLDDLTPIQRELRTREGTAWHLRRVLPYRTQDQRIEGVVVTYSDVTELKKAESALRISEQRFRTALKEAPIVVFNQDQRLRYTWVNSDGFGVPSELMINKRDGDLFLDRPDLQALEAVKRRVIETATGARREFLIATQNKVRCFDFNLEPLLDEQGEVVGLTGAAMDVTERNATAAALRRSEERYRTLIAATTSVVWTTGATGAFEEPQPAWQNYTGQTPEQQRGWGWLDVVHAGDRERLKNAWKKAVLEGSTGEIEARLWCLPRAEHRYMLIRAALIRDVAGGHREWICTATDIQERRIAEEALSEANRRIASVLISISDGFIALDRSWRYVYVNPSAEQIIGKSKDELLGRKLQDSFSDAPMLQILQVPDAVRAMEDRVLARFEAFAPRLDAWFEFRCFPSPEGMGIFLTDISERKRTEIARFETDQRMDQAIQAARGGFWELILDPRRPELLPEKMHLSVALKQIIGFTDDEFPGSRSAWEARIFEEDRKRLQQLRAEQTKERGSYEIEYRIQHRDGTTRWLWSRAHLGRDLQGRPVRWSGLDWDITQRKEDENLLRESEDRFRLIADAAPVMIWMSSPDRTRTYVNRRWAEFSGHLPEAHVDCVCWEGIHPDDEETARELMERAFEAHEPFELTYRRRRSDGRWCWILDRAVPRFDANKTFLGYIGGAIDISDRIELEAKLREQATQLAAADKRKDDFLAMLAHELRNPLAPIHNAVQLLRSTEGALRSDLDWVKDTIARQVQQMARLVDDLLDVARITRGRIELRRSQVALSEIVNRAVETVQPLIDSRGQKLEVQLPDRMITVDADPERISQVLANLLNNSAKYSDKNGLIELSATAAGGRLEIVVRDDGIGIPKELLPVIFDLFTQGDRALDRAQGGLGLGLTLSKSLVEMHGGTLTGASEGPGKGATFTVVLPLPESPSNISRITTNSFLPEPYVRAKRILVIDDSTDSAETLAILLRARGHQVRVANEGFEALEIAAAFRPEIALVDIGLPQMDGYELARRLRQLLAPERPILIAQTGYGQEEDRRRAKEAGFDHHLLKPIDFRALGELLS